MINQICPYAHQTELCPHTYRKGEAWHLYHCPLRHKHATNDRKEIIDHGRGSPRHP